MAAASPPARQHGRRGFVGAVLCGGASRRMGRDKAVIPLGDGRILAEVAGSALRAAGAGQVLAVGGAADVLGARAMTPIPDRFPGEGPLGGLLSALDAFAAITEASSPGDRPDALVVLTCDLVAIRGDEVVALLDALRAAPGCDVALPVHDGFGHYLTAAYRSTACEPLRLAFDHGERAVRRAAAGLVRVGLTELDPSRLRDADTPAELDAAVGAALGGRAADARPRGDRTPCA
ncbi:MAG: molybdenum cofactor guanylyltransferase [Acidimicrobiia bacterium]|nr:molybdenum cofactor guanylyltransferase [Acidimicrobiia bacterium]